MSTKTLEISEESKILHEIKPEIDTIISEIVKEIANNKLKNLFESFFDEKTTSSIETDHMFAYFILEILWLYEIIRRENKKIKLSKDIKKEKIINDLEMLKSKYGFEIFPVELISKLSYTLIEKIICSLESIEKNYQKKGKVDIRGVIFQNLLPEELKKITGSYHTRSDAAEILASISIDTPNSIVMDLSCGSGKLLVAATHRIKELSKNKDISQNQIFGVELMKIPACLAVINLFLENLNTESNVNIGNEDSLFLEPEKTISVLKSTMPKIKIPKADTVIMNPPFTRQESLKKEQKDALTDRFSKYGLVDKRIGLHGYFILLGNEFLEDGGMLSLVLPATVLRIESFTKLRKFLVDNFDIKHIIVSNRSSSFSYNSRFREILFVGRKIKSKKDSKARITVLNEKPVIGKNVKKIISALTEKTSKSTNGIKMIDVDNQIVSENYENLFRFISLSKEKVFHAYNKIFFHNDNLIKFNDYCSKHDKKLIRGWETLRLIHPVQSDYILRNEEETDDKSQWFFVKKEKSGIIIKNYKTKTELKIPIDSVKFGLRRLGDIDTINVNGKLDYIVHKKFKDISKFLSKPVIKNFDEWEKITEKKSSCLAFVRRFSLAGRRMRLCAIVSDEEFTPTQTMSLISHISLEDAKILSLWLNSSLHILQMIVERVETEGAYMELPEWAMKELFVIDPTKLSKNQKVRILSTYERISTIPFPTLSEQLKKGFKVRTEIDQLFLEILEINDLSAKDIQEIVKEEITELKFLVKAND